MKLLKVLAIAFCMIFAPLSFTQSGGAGVQMHLGLLDLYPVVLIAAIAAAVLAVAAIVDAQDGDKVAKPEPIPAIEEGRGRGRRSRRRRRS